MVDFLSIQNNYPKLTIPDSTRKTDNLYISNNTLYKIFIDEYYFIEEKERNVNFLIANPIPNTPKIYDKLYIKKRFTGYIMEYIPNTITFRQAINMNIPIERKIKAITDIYETLKYLHSLNIYLGDIHSDNVLISNEGNGYIIDLEEIRFPGDEFKFKQYYIVDNGYGRINIPSAYTDNVKLFISSLSLLIGKDLEAYVSDISHDISLPKLYNEVIYPLQNEVLTEYCRNLIIKDSFEYFSDFINEKNLIRK